MNSNTPTIADLAPNNSESTDSASPIPIGTKTRVYMVDDHALTRAGLFALISAEPDMEVCGEADDPVTALAEISSLAPHVVILDISLRGGSGIDLTKHIKAFSSAIDVVVVSMHDESIYAMRALKAGAKGYVMKGEAIYRVLDAIRRARRGELSVSDRVAAEIVKRCVDGTATDAADFPVQRLSNRELEIVSLIGEGMPTRQIAEKLVLSIKTIESHRVHIKRKLGLAHATKLVQFCVKWVEDSKAIPPRPR